VVASNDASGVTALHENAPGSWVVGDKGICPVGGALCSKGGPKLTPDVQLADYAPTPGGPRNCVRCRFFITGPAFLGGLVAHFNAIGVQLLAASERFRAKEAAIRKLEDELTAIEAQGLRSSRMAELHAAHDHHERDMLEVDELSHNLHAVYRLTERCRAIIARAKESSADGQVNLVLAGEQADLEAAIEMMTDFELMNSVCQVAKVYPGDDSTLANLRRARILDAMLARNRCRPVFSALSEEEALPTRRPASMINPHGRLVSPRLSRRSHPDCRATRTFQSAPLTLAATTSTTTSPDPATGSGKSPYFKTSGPPYCSMKAAFIVFFPLRSGADGLIAKRSVRRMVHRACDQATAAS